jgi:outer membrane protein
MTAALLAAPISAMAYEQGDWIIRGGTATVAPDASSDAIRIPTDPETVLPRGVDVDDDTQLGLTGTYMFRDKWAVELLASTPFSHDIELSDAPVDAGSAKHLPPTVTVNWYPRGGMDGWQPYLGLGLNYTYFWGEDVDGQLEAALGEIVGAPGPIDADLDLSDSWGLAVRAGFDYPINDRWALNASMYYIDIETQATISTDVAPNVKFDVDIDPFVYMFGVAYRF